MGFFFLKKKKSYKSREWHTQKISEWFLRISRWISIHHKIDCLYILTIVPVPTQIHDFLYRRWVSLLFCRVTIYVLVGARGINLLVSFLLFIGACVVNIIFIFNIPCSPYIASKGIRILFKFGQILVLTRVMAFVDCDPSQYNFCCEISPLIKFRI